MTTVHETKVKCGFCRKSSTQLAMLSTNSFGPPDCDLRPPEMHRSTMNMWLQLCPHCGYSAPALSESPRDTEILKSPTYQALLTDDRFPPLARRFLARALILEARDAVGTANALLSAAWACDDEGLDELASECRMRFVSTVARARPLAGPEDDLAWSAVTIDALRRAGDFAQSDKACVEVLARDGVPGPMRALLEFQRRLIANADRGCHTTDECAAPLP